MSSSPYCYCFLLATVLSWSTLTSCLDRLDLYPFGPLQGDTRLDVGDDLSSPEIELTTGIVFYDEYFTSLHVNLNGHITFDTDLPDYRSTLVIPLGIRLIAPFLADVDTELSGNVFYRETSDPTLRDKAAEQIQRAFSAHRDFYPSSLFIATWDEVGYYSRQYDQMNTFQVVIASDGRESFVFFLYPKDGIQWLKGDGKDSPVSEDVPAQVGFDAGDRNHARYYTLPGSGSLQVAQLTEQSNTEIPGLWLFRVGELDDKNVETPSSTDAGDEAGNDVILTDTCASVGQTACNANARCVDYAEGFCCECSAPFIGNGHECIRPEEPQRISGKVSGRINGQTIDNVDLHAYVVTNDGRTYTAISRMSPTVGYSLQSVYVVGSVLGFLFALPQQPGARNGFMVTGGQFNRTAVLQFTSTGESLTIRQTFTGQDAQGHMRMATSIEGRLPDIEQDSRVEVADYQEEYRRISAGIIKSMSTHTFNVETDVHRFTLDQTITYNECAERPLSDVDVIRIAVSRNFVAYSGTEQIVRFSQTNKVAGAVAADPCREARCDANADCVRQNAAAQCVCKAGFEGTGQVCRDVNECFQFPTPCDINAECYNTQGSFDCRCSHGFVGDGKSCQRDDAEDESCDIMDNCDDNAECVFDDDRRDYVCRCNPGYTGDGYQCTRRVEPPPQDCNNVAGFCDANAQCNYDEQTQRYSCQCNRGYEGTGRSCSRVDCRRDPRVCDVNARCERRGSEFTCVCRSGFQGDGYERCQGAVSSTSYLVYTQGMYIMHVPFTPTTANPGGQILYIPGQTAVGIDVDCMTHYFYWTDVSGKTISRARLDGTDSEVLVQNLGSPEGVAVDWISKNIYWTDSGVDKIQVSRLDGTSRKILFSDGLVNPRAIAVDPVRGVMFWTDWNREAPKIEKSNMDGTERRTLVSEGLGLPNGLAIDYDSLQVCWADAGSHKVECVNYDGRSQRTITTAATYPFGLTFFNSVLYWTDWERKTLPNYSKLIGQGANEDIELPLGANGRTYGISVVRSACPSGSNPCTFNNGGCRYLCLPSSKGGRTCACPDDITPDECNRIGLL